MIQKLTARTVEGIKPRGKRIEVFDTEARGLSLRVTPTGVKTWTVLYRHRGRLRRLTLGSADALSLADARIRARDAQRDVHDGIDVATVKQARSKAETIGDLAEDYIEQYAKRRKRSWKADQRILNAEILPHWRSRAIADITRRDVRELVNKIADRGTGILANRTVSLLSKLFAFALDEDVIQASPAVRIPRPVPEQARDRVLAPDELRAFWKASETLSKEMRAFYRLRLVTAQRGIEVGTMRWQDVDLESGWWTIPATVAKNKLAHRVPLTATAIGILKPLKPAKKKDDETEVVYVLAGARGKRQQAEAFAEAFGTLADFEGHDLRRTAASMMTSVGVSRLVVSKLLNHVERGVTAVYDRHSYDAEKIDAMQTWETTLKEILKPAKRGSKSFRVLTGNKKSVN